LDNHQNIIKKESTKKNIFCRYINKLPQKAFLNKKRKEEKLSYKNSLKFKNIKKNKSNNRTPKNFKNLVEIPNYDLYSSKIISFESKNYVNKLDSLKIDLNKKRLKTTIVVNYIEGCFLYLASTLNYNRCNFKIYEKQLNIFQN